MTQSAVWGLLARLHLNAAVYRDLYGTPNFTQEDMGRVIEYTDNIINSGSFSLSPEYFDLFNDDNNSDPELIFALYQRGVLERLHSRWAYWSVAGYMFPGPEFPSADGTDGPGIISDKTDSDVNKRLFPIPQSVVDAASGTEEFLEQNPGY